jgi:DNA-directed RNA polymerase I, II, and III subunit RPABC2
MADEKEPTFDEPEPEIDEDDDDDSSVASSNDEEKDPEYLVEGGDGSDYEEEDDDEEKDSDDGSVVENIDDNASIPSQNDSDEEEDDSDEDDDYLQKLDEHVRTKVIENHHPELKTLNYEEVEALATVIRDKNNIIIDALHRTLPILTRYEKARILGERAKQINSGAKPMIEVEPTLIDGYLIALKELEQKRIPFIIQRPLPNGGSEYWRVADLE